MILHSSRSRQMRSRMGAWSRPMVNPFKCWRSMVPGLLLVVALGLLPVYPLSANAQESSWECPAADAMADTAPGTPPDPTPSVAFPVEGGDLTIFAAASLTDAFEAMERELESENPALSITYNFGGSQALMTQLQQGAEADLFASANVAQMAAAAEAGLIAGDAGPFVHNRLA